MRVLLVSPNREQINMLTLPLGLGCVATATQKAGHDVQVIDLLSEADYPTSIKNTLVDFDPDVIGISIRNVDNQVMENTIFYLDQVRDVVTLCRAFSEAPVVLGGAGYSIFPESMLAYLGVEMGIQGEGEVAFPLLLARLKEGSHLSTIPGLHLRGCGLQAVRLFEEDLDRLPFPEDRLWIPSRYAPSELWIPVQTRRGCPMQCSYCSTAAIEGTKIRMRSPESVARWMASHVHAGFRNFHFVDNIFNIPSSYAQGLCHLLSESRLEMSWRSILYPGKVDSALISAMAEAGCKEVALGFESGCEQMLKSMKKGFTREDVREVSGLIADHGIRQMGFLLLGGPGETKETVKESLAFADLLPLDMVNVTVGIRIYPRTVLARISADEGVITPHDDLLFPRFYITPGLGDWLQDTVKTWMAERPHWVT